MGVGLGQLSECPPACPSTLSPPAPWVWMGANRRWKNKTEKAEWCFKQQAVVCLFFFLIFLFFLLFFFGLFLSFFILFSAELYTDTMRFAEGNISDQISVILRAGTHGGSGGPTVRQHRRDPPCTRTPPRPPVQPSRVGDPDPSPAYPDRVLPGPGGKESPALAPPARSGPGGSRGAHGQRRVPGTARPRSASGAASSAAPSLAAGRVPAGATPAVSAGRTEVSARGSRWRRGGGPGLPPSAPAPPIPGIHPGHSALRRSSANIHHLICAQGRR